MAISAFRSGAADILEKPVSSEILLEAVERAALKVILHSVQKNFRIVRYQGFTMLLTERKQPNSVNAGLMTTKLHSGSA